MSFNNKGFGVIAYGNGFTMWIYSTQDNINTVKEAGYFPITVRDMMALGDMVIVIAADTTDTLYVSSLIDGVTLKKLGE